MDATLRRLFTYIVALAIGSSATYACAQASGPTETESATDAKLIRMPMPYDQGMIIVVSREGAAAIRFATPTESANDTGNGLIRVSYDWRFVSRDDPENDETGSGRLYAKLVAGEFSHGARDIKAGPLEIQWRHRDKKTGYVEIDPQQINVHLVTKGLFGDDEPQKGQKQVVDLRRFLHSNSKHAAEDTANDESDDNAETKTNGYAGNVSAPANYQDRTSVWQIDDADVDQLVDQIIAAGPTIESK